MYDINVYSISANTTCFTNAALLLGQRRRRRTKIKAALVDVKTLKGAADALNGDVKALKGNGKVMEMR